MIDADEIEDALGAAVEAWEPTPSHRRAPRVESSLALVGGSLVTSGATALVTSESIVGALEPALVEERKLIKALEGAEIKARAIDKGEKTRWWIWRRGRGVGIARTEARIVSSSSCMTLESAVMCTTDSRKSSANVVIGRTRLICEVTVILLDRARGDTRQRFSRRH